MKHMATKRERRERRRQQRQQELKEAAEKVGELLFNPPRWEPQPVEVNVDLNLEEITDWTGDVDDIELLRPRLGDVWLTPNASLKFLRGLARAVEALAQPGATFGDLQKRIDLGDAVRMAREELPDFSPSAEQIATQDPHAIAIQTYYQIPAYKIFYADHRLRYQAMGPIVELLLHVISILDFHPYIVGEELVDLPVSVLEDITEPFTDVMVEWAESSVPDQPADNDTPVDTHTRVLANYVLGLLAFSLEGLNRAIGDS